MGTTRAVFVIAAASLMLGSSMEFTRAQIRYLTVQTPKSPVPPFALLPGNALSAVVGPGTAPAQVPRPSIAAVQSKPSLDKDELERRVVTFQQQRSEAGSASAQYELGLRYLQGRGVDRDLAAGRKWLTLSAAQGNSEAQAALAKLPPATTEPVSKSVDRTPSGGIGAAVP